MSSQKISSGKVLTGGPKRRVPPIGERRNSASGGPLPARPRTQSTQPPSTPPSPGHSGGTLLTRPRAETAPQPRVVPPLNGSPRRGIVPPPQALPSQLPPSPSDSLLVTPPARVWDQVLREASAAAQEAFKQLRALYHRYPERCVGSGVVFVLLFLFLPTSDDRSDLPSVLSAHGFRQRLMNDRTTTDEGLEGDEIGAAGRNEEILDLDAINALLQRFEHRPQIVTVSADRPRKRTVRTIRVPAEPSVTLTRYQDPGVKNLRLRHADREALTSHVLRIISRYGKRGVDRRSLASAIVAESLRQNYDPLFVAAVIKSESAFNTYARSYVGAQGLMQIMPATARYVEDSNALPRGSLSDPGHNLRLGVKYLKYLESMYNGNRVLTLMAYNWGPGHVEKTIKGGRRRGVPREVVNYALRILSDHSRWVQEVNQEIGQSGGARLS